LKIKNNIRVLAEKQKNSLRTSLQPQQMRNWKVYRLLFTE
jgi:hypothetical protein